MDDSHEPASPASPDTASSSSTSSSSSSSSSSAAVAQKKRPRNDGRHPTYRGVRMRSWGKWVSEIREPRKKSRWGKWVSEISAHDVAALAIKGRAAHLNFPDLAHLLPRPATAAPKDVQAAALLAAAADFPSEANAKSPDACSFASAASPQPPAPDAEPDPDNALFDLPDLLLDLRYETSSSLSCGASWAVDDDVAGGGVFRLEEPMLWDY
uniref:AP2/ERF domain-containing protein n=1 Tax=Oryza brachyantha TaxID=4533 RepID=J3M060_ORYBR